MARLRLHVTPGAREEGVVGWREQSLRLKVRARPEKGRASEAALRLLADHLGLPRSCLSIVRGAASRDKVVEVAGFSDDRLRARLESPDPSRMSSDTRSRHGRRPR
jgi:uncharacterized protein YggU (UPF0235/DUF167 family)